MRRHGRGERAGESAAQLGAPGRRDRVDQAIGLGGDDRGEAFADRIEPEGSCERVAVAPVLGAVEREHAGAHDPPGREPWVVDGEGFGVELHRPASQPREWPKRRRQHGAAHPER